MLPVVFDTLGTQDSPINHETSLDEWPKVWRVDLDDPHVQVEDCAKILDAEERLRAGRFAFPSLRRRYLVAHAALRRILGQTMGCPPHKVELRADVNGKPCLFPLDSPLRFNLSHSGSMALVAVSKRHEVGVDLERWSEQRDLLSIVSRHFSPMEQEAFWSLAPDQRQEGFYRWWTLKEACLKAVGWGLRYPLSRFSVEYRAQYRPYILEGTTELGPLNLWSLHVADAGWSGAIAWAGPHDPLLTTAPVVRCWLWHT
jgi:4'-phosphopantetheinyl transferase